MCLWIIYSTAIIFLIVTIIRCIKYFNKCTSCVNARESVGERRCRQWLESRFGVPFERIRPDWLKNDRTKRNLELDCYNEELALAVEFNGQQHYKYTQHFHATRKDLAEIQYRDQIKQQKCREHGVHLIVVPHDKPNIEEYLEHQISMWLARNN